MPDDSPAMAANAHELASEVERHKIAVMGYILALPPLLDQSLPLLDYYVQRMEQSHVSPAMIYRKDGTLYSQEPLKVWLSRAAASGGGRGLGLGPDLFTMPMQFVMIRIGDQMDRSQLDLYANDVPITQFVKHLRNASAHGNRWHFIPRRDGKQEPVHLAQCRQIVLDSSLHGKRAIWGSDSLIGPGEFLDVLDDLASYLRTLPNPTNHIPNPIPTLPPPPPPDPSEPFVNLADVAAVEQMLDLEHPGWRDEYGHDLDGVDTRHLVVRARAAIDSVLRVTEAGGLTASGMSADQIVANVCRNLLLYLAPQNDPEQGNRL